jgi:hypothetical protein
MFPGVAVSDLHDLFKSSESVYLVLDSGPQTPDSPDFFLIWKGLLFTIAVIRAVSR